MLEVIDMLQQGGLCMIPLGICSLAAVTIIIERCFFLRRSLIIDRQLIHVIGEYQGDESAEGALLTCRHATGPFARIVEEVLRTRHLGHAQSIEAVNAAGRTQLSVLERGLTLLEIIAGISPLLGLLGTVLGMVTVFEAITAQGVGDPRVLADGISKALVTTVVGLIVAIPALGFHSWLSRRAEVLAAEMQDLATGFTINIRELGERNHGGA